MYQQYKNKGVEIIGVSIDSDKDKWKEAIAKDKLPWPQVIDPNEEVSKYYGLEGLPQHFLLDKNGKIIASRMNVKRVEEILKERGL